jgi:glycine dehydrogenase subunit 2
MNLKPEKLVYELSCPGRECVSMPESDVPHAPLPPSLERASLDLPELDELTLVRHFTRLSQKNYSIDTQFYPLGSCTMKYNPKVNEDAAALPGWLNAHPLAGDEFSQGSLELIHSMQAWLCEIGGFAAGSLQPAAGAHGELAGVLIIRAYHEARGDHERRVILVPDSAHGTNPASCTMAGFRTKAIPSDAEGGVDMAALSAALCGPESAEVAGIMITNPNTLGLFDRNIEAIAEAVHRAGGLVYGDGANMNALVGALRPAAVGIDVMHYNLHKTFSTPHGGGGPGAGFVGVRPDLARFLPGPIVVKADGPIVVKADGPIVVKAGGAFALSMPESSIGRMKAFYGNFGILVRAYVYLRMLGAPGLRRAAETAVLNANYMKALIEGAYKVKYPRRCMHEFVAQGDLAEGVHTLDIAKRLIDLGFHPPTIYFPLIVPEAIMIEPTETESKETLDEFAAALLQIAEEARANPELLRNAPTTTPVGRLDEVAAARNPVLCHRG